MKRLLLLLSALFIATVLYPQDFFRGEFDKGKDYVILVNPTAGNLDVVNFLATHKLLDIDFAKVSFVGVYHISQEYDFSKSAEHIAKNKLSGYHLYEVRGDLPEEALFRENECSDDFRKIFENSIGIIFFGGQDIPPSVYGEENMYSETTDPGRHFFEVSFLFHLLGGSRNESFRPLLDENPEYMVTGFCLGMQSMNVATGGSLVQDIPAQLYDSHSPATNVKIDRPDLHRNYWQNLDDDPKLMGINLHPVHFTDNSFFGKTVKLPKNLRPLVYSSHHQAVRNLSGDLEVTALSNDSKVVEGVVHKRYPNVFAVQFHPEVSALYEDRAEVRFTPEDKPETLHSMMDSKSLRFHKKYWGHISDVIDRNAE
jgi:putative glutamine amidotransferase